MLLMRLAANIVAYLVTNTILRYVLSEVQDAMTRIGTGEYY